MIVGKAAPDVQTAIPVRLDQQSTRIYCCSACLPAQLGLPRSKPSLRNCLCNEGLPMMVTWGCSRQVAACMLHALLNTSSTMLSRLSPVLNASSLQLVDTLQEAYALLPHSRMRLTQASGAWPFCQRKHDREAYMPSKAWAACPSCCCMLMLLLCHTLTGKPATRINRADTLLDEYTVACIIDHIALQVT